MPAPDAHPEEDLLIQALSLLPPAEGNALRRCWNGPDLPALDAIPELVRQRLAELEVARNQHEFLDMNSARTAAEELLQLTDHVVGTPSSGASRLTCSAALYFLRSDDVEDDLTSPIGFDDDLAVIRAARRTLHLD